MLSVSYPVCRIFLVMLNGIRLYVNMQNVVAPYHMFFTFPSLLLVSNCGIEILALQFRSGLCILVKKLNKFA